MHRALAAVRARLELPRSVVHLVAVARLDAVSSIKVGASRAGALRPQLAGSSLLRPGEGRAPSLLPRASLRAQALGELEEGVRRRFAVDAGEQFPRGVRCSSNASAADDPAAAGQRLELRNGAANGTAISDLVVVIEKRRRANKNRRRLGRGLWLWLRAIKRRAAHQIRLMSVERVRGCKRAAAGLARVQLRASDQLADGAHVLVVADVEVARLVWNHASAGDVVVDDVALLEDLLGSERVRGHVAHDVGGDDARLAAEDDEELALVDEARARRGAQARGQGRRRRWHH